MAHRGRDRRRQLTAGLENSDASSQSCQTNQTIISQRTLSEIHQKHRLADKLRYHKIAGMWSGNHKTSFLNRNFRSKILKKIGKILEIFIFSSFFHRHSSLFSSFDCMFTYIYKLIIVIDS